MFILKTTVSYETYETSLLIRFEDLRQNTKAFSKMYSFIVNIIIFDIRRYITFICYKSAYFFCIFWANHTGLVNFCKKIDFFYILLHCLKLISTLYFNAKYYFEEKCLSTNIKIKTIFPHITSTNLIILNWREKSQINSFLTLVLLQELDFKNLFGFDILNIFLFALKILKSCLQKTFELEVIFRNIYSD